MHQNSFYLNVDLRHLFFFNIWAGKILKEKKLFTNNLKVNILSLKYSSNLFFLKIPEKLANFWKKFKFIHKFCTVVVYLNFFCYRVMFKVSREINWTKLSCNFVILDVHIVFELCIKFSAYYFFILKFFALNCTYLFITSRVKINVSCWRLLKKILNKFFFLKNFVFPPSSVEILIELILKWAQTQSFWKMSWQLLL